MPINLPVCELLVIAMGSNKKRQREEEARRMAEALMEARDKGEVNDRIGQSGNAPGQDKSQVHEKY